MVTMSPVLNQPSIGEAVAAVVAVVVAGRDPGSPHFELAHRLAVPGDDAVLVPGADFHERGRPALLGAMLKLRLVRGVGQIRRDVRCRAERRRLGHAPGVNDPEAVAPLEGLDQRLRNRGAAHDHRAERRQIVLARVARRGAAARSSRSWARRRSASRARARTTRRGWPHPGAVPAARARRRSSPRRTAVPRRWRETSARPAARRRRSPMPKQLGSETAIVCSTSARCE